jgi:Tol biopolymer transport system component
VHRLPGAVSYGSPRWSPDGEHLAFEANIALHAAEIRVLDLTRAETRTVVRTGQTRGLAWLPDGSGLVYASSAGSTLAYPPLFRLRRVMLDGSNDVPLPCEGAGYASYLEPDVTLGGQLVASRVAQQSDVFRYPTDGTPRENVTHAQRITRQTGQVQVPSASPDGAEVAYLSDSGGRPNIWVARVDGGRPPRQITDERDPASFIGLPVWSPRGDWITYWKGRIGSDAEQWLVRPDGTESTRLVQVRGGAAWSGDGEWLYYMPPIVEAEGGITCRVHVDGGEPVLVRRGAAGLLVTSDGSTAYFCPSDDRPEEVWRVSPVESGTPEPFFSIDPSRIPLWPHMYALSPDDRWLAAPFRERGTTDLFLISTEDGSLRQVTDFQGRATTIGRQVSWSSDGKHVFAALMESDADIVLLEGALQ